MIFPMVSHWWFLASLALGSVQGQSNMVSYIRRAVLGPCSVGEAWDTLEVLKACRDLPGNAQNLLGLTLVLLKELCSAGTQPQLEDFEAGTLTTVTLSLSPSHWFCFVSL